MKKKGLSLLVAVMMGISLLSVSLAAERTAGPHFTDVPQGHWAYSCIQELAERGAINGYPDGKFYPERTVTREEFAKIMVTAAGVSAVPAERASYADVPLDYWASPYIEAARAYMTAYQNGEELFFFPANGALREDIAVAVIKLKGYDVRYEDQSMLNAMFSDIDSISPVTRPYVALAVEKGIITGYVDGTFRGQDTITRSEAAAILWRAFQQGSGDKVLPEEVLPAATAKPAPSPTAAPSPTPVPTAAPTPAPTPVPTPELTAMPERKAENCGLVIALDGMGEKARLLTSEGTEYTVYTDTIQTVGTLLCYAGDGSYLGPYWRGEAVTAGYDSTAKRFGEMPVAEDCVLFAECTPETTGSRGAEYRAYALSGLGSIPAQNAWCIRDEEGRAVAVYMDLKNTPKGEVSDRVYGIVSTYNGTTNMDGRRYHQYTVNSGENAYCINISEQALKRGQLASFEPKPDERYEAEEISVYTTENAAAGYVKEYNEADRTLAYYTSVVYMEEGFYQGEWSTLTTVAVDEDVAIVYVDAENGDAGREIGINGFDAVNAHKNVAVVLDENNAAIAIFVETSWDCDILPG